jgi:hypothetical protein
MASGSHRVAALLAVGLSVFGCAVSREARVPARVVLGAPGASPAEQPDPAACMPVPPSHQQIPVPPSHQPVPEPEFVRPEPAATPFDPSNPHSCRDPAECVLHCPAIAGCCDFACGCRNAIRRDAVAAWTEAYARSCQRPPCPAVGCSMEHHLGATCVNGFCRPM